MAGFFLVLLKTYNCIVFTDFQQTKLRFFLKISAQGYSLNIVQISQISASIFMLNVFIKKIASEIYQILVDNELLLYSSTSV